MATHSSTLAWKIPWTEEPGGLQTMGSWRVGHDWSDLAAAMHMYAYAGKIKWHFLEELCTGPGRVMRTQWVCSGGWIITAWEYRELFAGRCIQEPKVWRADAGKVVWYQIIEDLESHNRKLGTYFVAVGNHSRYLRRWFTWMILIHSSDQFSCSTWSQERCWRVRNGEWFQSPGCSCGGRDGGQRGNKSYVSCSPSRRKNI